MVARIDVRCPKCGRLLAKRLADGTLVVAFRATGRSSRYRVDVTVQHGSVQCVSCGERVAATGASSQLRTLHDKFEVDP